MAKFYSLQFGAGDPRTFTGLAPTFLIFVRLTDGATIAPPSISESLTGSGLYQFTWGTTQPISFLADAATTSPGSAGRYVTGEIDPADRIDEVGTTLVALGTSNIALGTTNIALGVTNVSYGVLNFALGTTGVALGITNIALGTTNVALGITNVALGTTNVALGTTSVASFAAIGSTLVAQGSTLVAIGNTSIAIGSTNSQMITNEGVTLVAIGNTLSALGLTNIALSSTLFTLIGTPASPIGDNLTDPNDLFGYSKRIAELIEGQEQFVKGSGALTMYDRTGATTLATRTVTNNASLVVKA